MVLAEGPVGYARLAAGDQRGADRGGEGRAPHHHRRPRRPPSAPACTSHPTPSARERLVVRAHRLSQGHGPGGARARRSGRRTPRARRARRRVRPRPRARGAVGPRRSPRPPPQRRRCAMVAAAAGVDVVATNNVHYATPAQRPLATALAAVRARRSLDEIDGWLPASPLAHLRSAARAGAPLRSLAGGGGAHRRDRARVRLRPAPRRARAARSRRPARPHRDELAARAHHARCRRRATRARTRSTSRRCTRSRTSST